MVMKLGVGRWKAFKLTGILRSKRLSNCVDKLRRLLGQQGLGEFTGLHIDIDTVWLRNSKN